MHRKGRSLLGRATALAAVLAATICTVSHTEARATGTIHYTNPVFNRPFPDPMVLRNGPHDYWAYGTTLGWVNGYFPILHSTDFVHWRYVGDAFKQFPSWSKGDFWAPDVVRHGSTYVMYYTAMGNFEHCIGVATASRPGGPFKDHGMVSCAGPSGYGYIDPDLFVDRDGKAYLYVSVDATKHNISVIPMKPDLIHPAGKAKMLFGVSQPWESITFTTVEGPFVVRHGSLYYLFYSGNDFTHRYAMGFATSRSPTGPFTKYKHNPILKGNAKVSGPGGGSVVEGPDGRLWLVYHGWRPHHGSEDQRTMRIDPIVWHGNVPSITIHPH